MGFFAVSILVWELWLSQASQFFSTFSTFHFFTYLSFYLVSASKQELKIAKKKLLLYPI